MGTSVRTRTLRYVVWGRWDAEAHRPLLAGAEHHAALGEIELYR